MPHKNKHPGACRKPVRKPVSASARALQATVYFAPALIAAKPVKPCDGAVFRAFYLLLFLQ